MGESQTLTDEEIKTTWTKGGTSGPTMQTDPDSADPDTKDADGTDGDSTDTTDGDTGGDADGTDS
jgi:hypothetical protein